MSRAMCVCMYECKYARSVKRRRLTSGRDGTTDGKRAKEGEGDSRRGRTCTGPGGGIIGMVSSVACCSIGRALCL